jgi:hypothetical protein
MDKCRRRVAAEDTLQERATCLTHAGISANSRCVEIFLAVLLGRKRAFANQPVKHCFHRSCTPAVGGGQLLDHLGRFDRRGTPDQVAMNPQNSESVRPTHSPCPQTHDRLSAGRPALDPSVTGRGSLRFLRQSRGGTRYNGTRFNGAVDHGVLCDGTKVREDLP